MKIGMGVALGIIFLVAASTLAIAAGPPDVTGTPEDRGPPDNDPSILISANSIDFVFFNNDETVGWDRWEITVEWNEKYGVPNSATYTGDIVLDRISPAYSVTFLAGTESDEGGDVTPPITLRTDGDLLYPVIVNTYDVAGTLIISATGTLDLNLVE
ncbi:MAG: hypothetical protein E4G94_00475 [ANME-2 cluster archaeon]|nr:MAG: hypothetical protein E4G94_00475 [ANME-2 cluster archaeon]